MHVYMRNAPRCTIPSNSPSDSRTASYGWLRRAMMISMSAMLSDEPGTYILILKSAVTRRVRVGRLGNLQLCPGYYVYIGSAFGPGGLRARIDHHQRLAKRPHWHIDYLRRHTRLTNA